jgi:uncharacterized zinc-type alcohol dehydrogenase-like protein
MCKQCNDQDKQHQHEIDDKDEASRHSRRRLLKAGVALAAMPLLAGVERAQAQTTTAASASNTGNGPYPARAWGANAANAPLQAMNIQRRALQPHDVLLDVLYCGVCHSDIHTAKDEWHNVFPTVFPCVPGHEVIGRVAAIGSAVNKFRVGDIGGVGCLVSSCLSCEPCEADREQNCLNGATFTYNSPDAISGGVTYGGYSDKIVVPQHFVISIPAGADLAATAPLLCAGVTTFSPMQHWKLNGGQRVGVIGLGGLGHIAVKLAVARKAEVTVFTTTPGKVSDAKRLGAKEAILWNDAASFKRLARSFDLLISTVPQAYPMQSFISLLKLDATLVNLGAMDNLQDINGLELVMGRNSVAGSVIGGIAETQQVIDYCTARDIKADIELIHPDQLNTAYQRVINKDVRYRFVIDIAGQSRNA